MEGKLVFSVDHPPTGPSRLLTRPLVVVLGTLLVLGTAALSPVRAYAATPEVRTSLPTGIAPDIITNEPTVVGSSAVIPPYVTTDLGQSWSSTVDTNVGSQLYAGHGVVVGFTSAPCVAHVLHLASGVMDTFSLTECPTSMNDHLLTAGWGLSWSVYDYVAGTAAQPLTPPSGGGSPSDAKVYLTASGGVLWVAPGTGYGQLVAYAPNSSTAPGPWATMDGSLGWYTNPEVGFTTSATQILYSTGSTSAITLCSRPLSGLAGTPTCTPQIQGYYVGGTMRNYGSTTLVFGTDGILAWTGATALPVQVPADLLPLSISLGDTAYVSGVDANTVPFVKKVNSDGSLGASMPLPTTKITPNALALTPGMVVGADSRDGSIPEIGGPAWSRAVSSAGFGTETQLGLRAYSVSASSGRSATVGMDGVQLYDRAAKGLALSQTDLNGDVSTADISGPYVSLPSDSTDQTTIIRADGTTVGTFPSDGALFGSTYYAMTRDNGGIGPIKVTANDLTGKAAPRVTTLANGGVACTVIVVWNDRLGMSCNNVAEVFSLATGQVQSSKSNQGGMAFSALGDGYAVVWSPGELVGSTRQGAGTWLWNLATDSLSDLGTCDAGATDGIGHVLCSTATELVWRDYSSLATSPARLLGVLAPSTVDFTKTAAWAPGIDATKPLNAGTLVVKKADGTVVRTLSTPATTDGSIRGVTWDGADAAGKPVAVGTYTYSINAASTDGTGGLVAIDGAAAATGTVVVSANVADTSAYKAFVKAAYQDFLGRQPTADELAAKSTALANGSLTRPAFLSTMANSDEWLNAIVTKMYADTLGRAPDAAGLAGWVALLRNKTFSVADVASRFYSSDEYYLYHAGGTPTSWVTALYTKLLTRAPDAAGLAAWVSHTTDPSYGRDKVAYGFYQSTESRMHRVLDLYQALLKRNPDATGWPYWTDQVLTTGDITLAINLAGSQEYDLIAQTRF